MGFRLSKPNLRANLEKDLQAICDGQKRPEDVLRQQIACYKDIFIKAQQSSNVLLSNVNNYIHLPDNELIIN